MYSQAHSELSAIRPGMMFFVTYLAPALATIIGCVAIEADFNTLSAILGVVVLFLLASGGVTTDEALRHQNRLMYVAAAALTRAVQMALVVALLLTAAGRTLSSMQAGLVFGVVFASAMTTLSVIAIRVAVSGMLRAPARRVVFVAMTDASLELARSLEQDRYISVEIRGFFDDRSAERLPDAVDFPVIGRISDIGAQLANDPADHVFICLPMESSQRIGAVMDQLLDSAASVHYLQDFVAFKPIHESLSWVAGVPVYTMISRPDSGLSGVAKRAFDIVGAGMALILLSPLLLLVAALVRLESPGPALFRQQRYGTDGRPFAIYKFRSMTVAACASSDVVQARCGDARVTRIGRFIRKSSIDELPQLFNILRGDMSLVGPRPHAVPHNEYYRSRIRGYMLRHKVRPGLTGWAQVHGLRGETETLDKMENRVRFDLDYLRQWSFALDLYIVLLTVRQVMRGV